MPMYQSFYGVIDVGKGEIVAVGVWETVGVMGVNVMVGVDDGVNVLEGVRLGVMDGVKLGDTKTVAVPVTDGV